MQRLSEEKRRKIIDAAAKLFAERAYHEVRLDDVAVGARVGKGTLYIYFKSKEDLFDGLLVEGFGAMVDRVRATAEDSSLSAWEALDRALGAFVDWASHSPHFYQLFRVSDEKPPTPRMKSRRREFGQHLEQILVRGIEAGEMVDPHPELTAQFIPGCVRAAFRHGPDSVDLQTIKEQILRVLGNGIRAETAVATA